MSIWITWGGYKIWLQIEFPGRYSSVPVTGLRLHFQSHCEIHCWRDSVLPSYWLILHLSYVDKCVKLYKYSSQKVNFTNILWHQKDWEYWFVLSFSLFQSDLKGICNLPGGFKNIYCGENSQTLTRGIKKCTNLPRGQSTAASIAKQSLMAQTLFIYLQFNQKHCCYTIKLKHMSESNNERGTL